MMDSALSRASALAVALAAVLCTLGGCAIERADPGTPTGGLSMEMMVRRGEDSIAIYTVRTDGTFEFAGGKSALFGSVDWTGQVTPADVEQLHHLIEVNQWLAQGFSSSNEPPDLRYEIRVRTPRGHRRIDITGESPRIAPVRELLEAIAGRRNDAVLERLPKPSLERLGE